MFFTQKWKEIFSKQKFEKSHVLHERLFWKCVCVWFLKWKALKNFLSLKTNLFIKAYLEKSDDKQISIQLLLICSEFVLLPSTCNPVDSGDGGIGKHPIFDIHKRQGGKYSIKKNHWCCLISWLSHHKDKLTYFTSHVKDLGRSDVTQLELLKIQPFEIHTAINNLDLKLSEK